MAVKRKNSGLGSVDSWTSNGYGVETSQKLTPKQKETARQINADVSAKKGSKPKPKAKKK